MQPDAITWYETVHEPPASVHEAVSPDTIAQEVLVPVHQVPELKEEQEIGGPDEKEPLQVRKLTLPVGAGPFPAAVTVAAHATQAV
jgi:hypothetical protein